MYKLTPTEARKHWIMALRSGRFKQTRNTLRRVKKDASGYLEECHCCLGVACELYRELEDPSFVKRNIDDNYDGTVGSTVYGPHSEARTGTLPTTVQKWLGLMTDSGTHYDGEKRSLLRTLVTLNDTDRKTFPEIADIIEAKPTGMFVPEPALNT